MTGKVDVYQIVTDRMLAQLEAGTVPWRKPWNATHAPRNLEGREYRGINTFLLSLGGFSSPFWMTFKQAKERGGAVKKGEKGTLVIFWKQLLVDDKETGGKKRIPLLRYYNVFNLEQTEDVKLPKKVAEWDADLEPVEPIAAAEAIVSGYENGPSISYGADEAFYMPSLDIIKVPALEQYATTEEFYSTLFHEMGHSTGHKSRLDRGLSGMFGSHAYGREELIAEMTSAFLQAEAGLEAPFENSAAYLASWIRTIKADPKAVVVAAGAAQRAADHILGRAPFVPAEEKEVKELVTA